MSKLYDTIEPAVIDEQMLKQCVEEQGPKEEAGRIANQEGIDFNEVLHLRLDFKSKHYYQFEVYSRCNCIIRVVIVLKIKIK